MSLTAWIILGVVNIPLYLLVGRFFFKDWDSFGEAIYYWFKPDILSWFDGEHTDDFFAELKLGLFIAACGGLVWVEATRLVEPYILPMFQ